MSAFRRGSKWVAKFDLDHKQLWVPGGPWESKRDAAKAEREHRDFLAQPTPEETCRTFADRWVKEWPRPQRSTQRLYEAAARRFADHFGDQPLADVNRLEARTWALSVPRSVSRVIGTMMEDARNVGLVTDNNFTNLRLPMLEKRPEITAPTLEEYRRLLEGALVLGGYAQEFRAMITFAAWTGVRQGELFGLQWQDVGIETLRISRARKLDGSLGLPKNGKERTIAFLPPARVLEDVPRRTDPFIFHGPQGNPLLKGTHGWSWKRVVAAAGTQTRWHDLRHFAATQLLELGLDHFAVSIQLGHTDGGKLVMARYGHPSEEAARRRLLAAFELPADFARSDTRNAEAQSG